MLCSRGKYSNEPGALQTRSEAAFESVNVDAEGCDVQARASACLAALEGSLLSQVQITTMRSAARTQLEPVRIGVAKLTRQESDNASHATASRDLADIS